jgi:hypothetical protein
MVLFILRADPKPWYFLKITLITYCADNLKEGAKQIYENVKNSKRGVSVSDVLNLEDVRGVRLRDIKSWLLVVVHEMCFLKNLTFRLKEVSL